MWAPRHHALSDYVLVLSSEDSFTLQVQAQIIACGWCNGNVICLRLLAPFKSSNIKHSCTHIAAALYTASEIIYVNLIWKRKSWGVLTCSKTSPNPYQSRPTTKSTLRPYPHQRKRFIQSKKKRFANAQS